ncbi:polysaccharide deacetylase [Enemella dayhoffiae]|uniref:Polysaccharide deacetylase n=1 Tax=Enemella dayhoffiae TaxID=2016507 RepID=A0A255GZE2_9ACTN|nr:polysaccharide deacetylase family protein [Enemella dayhoffiae]OYO20998.1 polysaccharide deacetylase [Enemella dayhoffiae]
MNKARSLQLLALAGLAPLILSACGTPPAPDQNSGQGGGQAPGGTKQAPPPPPEAKFAQVDNAQVKSLQLVTLRNDPAKVVAEVPQVPNARNLSQAIEVVREKQLRQATWAKASQVDIKSQVVASSPEVVGVAVTSTSTENGGQVQRPVTIWYDAAESQSYSSPILIDAGKWGDFKKAALDAGGKAKLDAGKLGRVLDEAPAPEGNGPAMGFDNTGALVLRFGSGVLAPEAQGLLVPKEAVTPALSPFGTKAQAAATSPSAYTAVGQPKQGGAQTTPSAAPSASGSASPGATAKRPSTAIGPDCRVLKCVALTYDDGPGPGTGKVLDVFNQAHAAATFFQMGEGIKGYPDTVRKVATMGMEVANHSSTHPDISKLSGAALDKQVGGNSEALKALTGRPPLLFRPPYGAHNDNSDKVIGAAGMAVINWSVDTLDWQTKSTPKTENSAVYQGVASPHAIVLMHDIHDFTVAAAPAIVQGLQDKGATLVTVSELTVNSGGVYPGRGYCHGTQTKQDGFGCKG